MGELESEQIVLSAPMSFHGSTARIWPPLAGRARTAGNRWAMVGWYLLALTAISFAWTAVLCWYFIFGLLLVPYRLVRRSQRKRKLEDARHRESLAALAPQHQQLEQSQPVSLDADD